MLKWLRDLFAEGPRFSEDREHYAPEYPNSHVSEVQDCKVALRMRLRRAGEDRQSVEWVPESGFTRDPDTQRIGIFKDIQGTLRQYSQDRVVLLTIVPVWSTNEITDAGCGGLIASIDCMFCGVPPHPQYTRIMEPFQNAEESSVEQESADPHPDDTGEFKFFIQAGQRGAPDKAFKTEYVARVLPKGVSQFGGAEDALLTPASLPTLRDAIQNDRIKGFDGGDVEPVTVIDLNAPPLHNAEGVALTENDNNVKEDSTVVASSRDIVDADFEIMRIDHPMMIYLNEFGETLRKKALLYRSDIIPMDVKAQEENVRKRMHFLPVMYRVRCTALTRIRQHLCKNTYKKIHYTRLTRTGLRIVTSPQQNTALYKLYKDTLVNHPEDAPCVTIILHVTYMIVKDSDRIQRVHKDAEL